MVNMTLAIPDGLHEKMKQFSDIKWSEVARQALWNQARKLEIMDKILSKSKCLSSRTTIRKDIEIRISFLELLVKKGKANW